ncbi:polyprotein [Phanerochaete sordida]|uniref:RNA-directed DNA polymerase n=1 Tax=Phanerochaete sordida TaxID=48140 RepID=A0A9P3GT63_9APHY|nr:polyprotein [Phanerochaete sordida]
MKLLGSEIEQVLVEFMVPQARQKITKYVFRLVEPVLENLTYVRKEFDSILRSLSAAAGLSPPFQIDAQGVILNLLQGSDTLLEIRAAFIELQGRIKQAKRHFRRGLATLLGVPEASPVPSVFEFDDQTLASRHPEDLLRKVVLHSRGVGRLTHEELRQLDEGAPLPAILKGNEAYWKAAFGSPRASPSVDEEQVERHLLGDGSRASAAFVPKEIPSPEADRPIERTAKGKAVAFQATEEATTAGPGPYAARVEDATPSDKAFASPAAAPGRAGTGYEGGGATFHPQEAAQPYESVPVIAPTPQYPASMAGAPAIPATRPDDSISAMGRGKDTPPHQPRSGLQRMSLKPEQFDRHMPGVAPGSASVAHLVNAPTAPPAGQSSSQWYRAPAGGQTPRQPLPATAPAYAQWPGAGYRPALPSQAATFQQAHAIPMKGSGPNQPGGGGQGPPQGPRQGGSQPGPGPGGAPGGGGPPDDPAGTNPPVFPLFNSRPTGAGGGGPPGPPDGSGASADAEGYGGRPSNSLMNLQPRIDMQLKPDDLPAWDGNFGSAIEYMVQVEELAALGGYLPQQLGLALSMRFAAGSEVANWFTTLPMTDKDEMRTDYAVFLRRIRDDYLGPDWCFEQMQEYAEIKFRQPGEEKETPCAFAHRRVIRGRVLSMVPVDDRGRIDGAAEVKEALRVFPIPWKTKLDPLNLKSSAELQLYLRRLSESLIYEFEAQERARKGESDRLQLRDLLPVLDQLQVTIPNDPRRSKSFRSFARPRPSNSSRESASKRVVRNAEAESQEPEGSSSDEDEGPFAAAFAVIKSSQRQPSGGRYAFSRRDDVRSPMRRPPVPCKACGSRRHWDAECPMASAHRTLKDVKEVHAVESDRPPEQASLYDAMYESLSREYSASAYVAEPRTAVADSQGTRSGRNDNSRQACKVEIEDLEDAQANGGRSLDPLDLDDVLLRHRDDREPVTRPRDTPLAPPKASIELQPRRTFAGGRSSHGISVLSMKGRAGSTLDSEIDLRLDSGADVSLVSSSFYRSLKQPPKLKKGERLKLWQLLDRNTQIDGYVTLNLYVRALDGTEIRLQCEAYVVPDMSVPILLGEDFQRTYEMNVRRDLEKGTRVSFADLPYEVPAMPVAKKAKIPALMQSMSSEASFVRAKTTRRKAAQRTRRNRAAAKRREEVLLREDTVVPPGTVRLVAVDMDAEFGQDWLVEKSLIEASPGRHLAVPNCLVSADDPRIPLTNPTDEPLKLAAGTVLGLKKDPTAYFDTPQSLSQLERMLHDAARIAALAQATHPMPGGAEERGATEADSADAAKEAQYASGDPRVADVYTQGRKPESASEAEEEWGPKTAEAPDPTIYPSEKMQEILDVGAVPEHLKEKVWEMLRRRQKAFSFDGRLGHLPTRVHIRTVDGLQPIAVPMYGSSPAKRLVIEEQLKKWFEQDVIEPSISPWSAPVVIAYRNGKPRFCVDYRKLNAQTVSDEFPIPRQSEILAALSGAQVLSSLDALAGFTQMEFEESEREKTAFRTHLGLFQFKRMPFGLKNGPSIFQRTMQSILAPFLWMFCLVYIDDIVVYSKTYEEHIEHLDKVLGACEEAGLTLSPAKCHLFYPSVLLLGHKVSRLGLSTHAEKVKAILELAAPTKVAQLQSFLGLVGYFSSFIPYYSMIAAPLFALLKKNAPWRWGPDENHAFEELKKALQQTPVLGHPEQGKPYRLYTDASDEALGCALQQVQPIQVADLKGTKYYDRLKKAFEESKPVPKLVTTLPVAPEDAKHEDKWGPELDQTAVHVERVIGYWSRTFKQAERNYSATEREALAAKEGLVKFQPFIEGEKIALVTDHAALQWAQTYENANRRLAAWGAVFSAYKPGLVICHRPGRIHSNVDPLSRLPRDARTGHIRGPPEHQSPAKDDSAAIEPDNAPAEAQERVRAFQPKAAFFVEKDEDAHPVRSAFAVTRAAARRARGEEEPSPQQRPRPRRKRDREPTAPGPDAAPAGEGDASGVPEESQDPFEKKAAWEGENAPPRAPLLHLEEDRKKAFVEGYRLDPFFKARWEDPNAHVDSCFACRRH